ncbi:flagellar hook-basal body complex protein FliE [Selenomonas ruminantium]|uniref:Flagellar hook-basal body complex protein FliE n=1 Tax=Selenomonas ruminantium TaxID=971 RepID=A0A1H0R0X6_SELRU|nr:flagellar hook-basal body complex protein FliE [Selenomonas ruminantium]SDP23184.1 flagellar hook-basal body complex protein FliE [Selenomonas ruminantium]
MEIAPLAITPVSMSATSHLGETQEPKEVKNFGQYLTDALKKTNGLQLESERQNALLAAGRIEDVSQVVIAAKKAEIALQLTLQLRNKAVTAYQEIMRMQV